MIGIVVKEDKMFYHTLGCKLRSFPPGGMSPPLLFPIVQVTVLGIVDEQVCSLNKANKILSLIGNVALGTPGVGEKLIVGHVDQLFIITHKAIREVNTGVVGSHGVNLSFFKGVCPE
jgi:hypothetical protein